VALVVVDYGRRKRTMRRYSVILLLAVALAGCGGGGTEESKDTKDSLNPLDHTQKQVEWSIQTKKELKEMAKKRADEANKILDERFKTK
jgi:PBP1b-binding outer membrane lipoprotein LpoB